MDLFGSPHILYQDEWLIAVEKPSGLPVHQNDFLPKDADYLNKIVGQLTGKSVYNVHRLDAKTSGVMILALSTEAAKALSVLFEFKKIEKKYIAIVKGNPGSGTFDEKVLVKKKSKFKKPAVTHYETLQTIHTTLETKEADTLMLSQVLLTPETGRWHQLRQHLAKNRTDIIGDTHHGDFSLNRKLTEITGIKRLMLHASEISFDHPFTHQPMTFTSPLPVEFTDLFHKINLPEG